MIAATEPRFITESAWPSKHFLFSKTSWRRFEGIFNVTTFGATTKLVAVDQNMKFYKNTQTFVYSEYR